MNTTKLIYTSTYELMAAYLNILKVCKMYARATNTHCTSRSAIRNGIINSVRKMAMFSSQLVQSVKYALNAFHILHVMCTIWL